MKKLLTILTLICIGIPHVYTQKNDVNITDVNFLQTLIKKGVDINGDGKISHTEAEAVITLYLEAEGISDLTGIEAFLNLQTLDCSGNQLSTLDVSYNTQLKLLKCSDNSLIYLEGLNNTSLTELWCDFNELTYLEVSGNPSLSYLNCSGNKLNTLYVSENTALTGLWCNGNELNSLDVSKNTALTTLVCSGNNLTTLDLVKNTSLTTLRCHGNRLESLDISKNTALTELWCNSNELTGLDVSGNLNLEVLNCADNQLIGLEMPEMKYLWYLNCGGNAMINLDLTGNPNLKEIYLENMRSLTNVCVWNLPFPVEGVNVYAEASPNVNFSDDCAPPVINLEGQYPDPMVVKSSENGIIWLVPTKKDRIFSQICDACIDSFTIDANVPVDLCLDSCKNIGQYWLYASDSEGNVSEPVFFTYFGPTSGIKDKVDETFRIYPNPANSMLNIVNMQAATYRIEITTLNGQLVYKKELEGTTNQLNISCLSQGEYIITIRSRDSVRTGKLLKL